MLSTEGQHYQLDDIVLFCFPQKNNYLEMFVSGQPHGQLNFYIVMDPDE